MVRGGGWGSVVAALVVGAAALTLCSCEADGRATRAATPITASPSASAGSSGSSGSSGSPGSPGSPAPSSAAPFHGPAGHGIAIDGVRFEIPRGWISLDPAKVTGPDVADSPEVKALADRLGVSPDQFVQLLGKVDLYAVSDRGAQHGFLDNMNVLRVDIALPNDDQVRLQLARLGAHVDTIRDLGTGAGPAVDVSYHLTTAAGVAVFGRGLYVGRDDAIVEITFSSVDAGVARQTGDRALASLTALQT